MKRRGPRSAVRFTSGLGCVLLFATTWCAISAVEAANDDTTLEYGVKAAFLLNFTKFVEWPPNPASADPSFNICILGEDPFHGVLDRIAEGEAVNGRRLVVQKIRRVEPRLCRMIFIGRGEPEVPRLLESVGPGVLTVGEGERFLHEGGMIAFVIEGRRVRFDVNQRAASRAGLQISSRLLSVARSVER